MSDFSTTKERILSEWKEDVAFFEHKLLTAPPEDKKRIELVLTLMKDAIAVYTCTQNSRDLPAE